MRLATFEHDGRELVGMLRGGDTAFATADDQAL